MILKAFIKNFKKSEIACRCCGMYNVSDDLLIAIQEFRNIIKKPLIVNSCCRCLKHNKEVGGVSNSHHICEGRKCDAIDVFSPDIYTPEYSRVSILSVDPKKVDSEIHSEV